MAGNAEIQNGDRLVTSGIDGIYPAGLPVATVVQDRARRRAQLCPRDLPAAGRGRSRPLRARAVRRDRAAAAARGSAVEQGAPLGEGAPRAGERQRRGDGATERKSEQHPVGRLESARSSASFALALLLNFLPWTRPAAGARLRRAGAGLLERAPAAPRRPRRRLGLGLLMDVGNGVLLGQHALAYSLLAFFAIWLSRRILWFGAVRRRLHVARLLAARAGARAGRAHRRRRRVPRLGDLRRARSPARCCGPW